MTKVNDRLIRLKLVETLLEGITQPDAFIALEARYGILSRRADVIYVSSVAHAYEIKSDRDNLDKLQAQIEEYNGVFDFVTVVTTSRYLQKVREGVPSNVGIAEFRNDRIVSRRKARLNRALRTRSLISVCSNSVIRTLISAPRSATRAALIERAENEIQLSTAREAAHREMRRRYQRRFELFQSECRPPLRWEDLASLGSFQRLAIHHLLGEPQPSQLLADMDMHPN